MKPTTKFKFIISVLLISFAGCTTEDFFTETELNFIDAYEVGDTFLMASSTGDTLIFTVYERKIEVEETQCPECIQSVKYQDLIYGIKITSFNGYVYNGRFWISSFGDVGHDIVYDFTIEDCNFFGALQLEIEKDTMIVNSICYPQAICNERTCFVNNIGFIKISEFCGGGDLITLSLIP